VTTAEFSRPLRLDAIGSEAVSRRIEAEAEERAALARRFGLLALDSLAAELAVSRDAAGILVDGRIAARLVQACVATGEPVPAAIDAPFRLRFVEDTPAGEEIELGEDDLDTLLIEGGAVDLGEAAAETLALEIDPYPRCPNAAEALRAAGVVSEDEVETGPFAALKALKDRMGKDD